MHADKNNRDAAATGSALLPWGLIAPISVLLIACVVRVANYDQQPLHDELYHMLAAQSWLQDGTYGIGDGVYTRAALYTNLVGMAMSVVGDDLGAIRLLNIAVGLLLVLAVFFGVNAIAGRSEGFFAALIVALAPGAIFLSQMIRFYSLQALCFWVAALLAYVATGGGVRAPVRVALLLSAAALFAVAAHLQVTTLIGLVALIAALALIRGPAVAVWLAQAAAGARRAVVAAAAIVLAGALSFAYYYGPDLLARYQGVALWSETNTVLYYFKLYREQYGALWSLTPAALIVAALRYPRPAWFFAIVFGVAFVLHSFGGMRSERFLFYGFPFLASLWGIALAIVVSTSHQWLANRLRSVAALSALRHRSGPLAAAVMLAAGLFFTLATPAAEMTLRMALDKPAYRPSYWHGSPVNWTDAAPSLRELASQVDVLVTTQGLHALYFIGDYHAELSPTSLSDYGLDPDATHTDPRTGRLTIGSTSTLGEMIAGHASGAVVVHEGWWRKRYGVVDVVADFLETNLCQWPARPGWNMRIFVWGLGDDPEGDEGMSHPGDGCDTQRAGNANGHAGQPHLSETQ